MFPVIILDIEQTGIEFIHPQHSEIRTVVEGKPANLSWVKSNSAFLTIPMNGSPCAMNDEEIFFGKVDGSGTNTHTLKIFDVNKDGRIDANDDFYQHLYLWFDKDQDGICSLGETYPLSHYGITMYLNFKDVLKFHNETLISYEFTFDINYYDKQGKHIKIEGLKVVEALLQFWF